MDAAAEADEVPHAPRVVEESVRPVLVRLRVRPGQAVRDGGESRIIDPSLTR